MFVDDPSLTSGSCVPLRRPHYHLDGNALHFLASRRPTATLSAREIELWDALRDEVSLDGLRARFGPEVDAVVGRLVEVGVCLVAEGDFPANRRRVLVIEPHPDDAVASLGGTLWRRRRECVFTLAALASRSNFTSYFYLDRDYFDVDEITALREAEGRLAARLLGGRSVSLGRSEITLAYRGGNWSLDWFREHGVSVNTSIGRRYPPESLIDATARLEQLLSASDAEEVWMPLGVGLHSDHQLTRDACLQIMLRDGALLRDRVVRLYEEVPYAAHDPGYNAALVRTLSEHGARLRSEPEVIEPVFDQKLRLASVYASQFKVEALRGQIEACARQAATEEGRAEQLWRVERAPDDLDPLTLGVDHEIIDRDSERIRAWFERQRMADRVRLLLVVPSGRWAADRAILLRALPKARLDVYVTSAGLAEIAECESPRVRVQRVALGRVAWGALALRLALSPSLPTLFISGRQNVRAARALAGLWPRADRLVLGSLDQLLPAATAVAATPVPAAAAVAAADTH